MEFIQLTTRENALIQIALRSATLANIDSNSELANEFLQLSLNKF